MKPSILNTLIGTNAVDVIFGANNADTDNGIMFGGAGEDWMIGGTGNDRLNGGTGPDHFYCDANGSDTVTVFCQTDSLSGIGEKYSAVVGQGYTDINYSGGHIHLNGDVLHILT